MKSSVIIALVSLLGLHSSVTAFAPIGPRHQHVTTSSKTRLAESILEAEDRYLEKATNGALNELPDVIYTVVYNPETPEEGVHTMKSRSDPGQDIMLCFEGMADCIVFARTIKEDPALNQEPVPTPVPREVMQQACQGMGLQMAIVPMESKTQW